ncbi:MAG: PA14 domain-containing protein [Phycisphaerales bacterium]|nr:PA14 domain-containing protein [Phycisphaerales bacterium]
MRPPRFHHQRSCFLLATVILTGLAQAQDQPSPDHPFVFAREIWRSPATAAALRDDATFAQPPDRVQIVSHPVGADDAGDHFVQRIRGWIEAPRTGSYRFSIASDDDGLLFFSPSPDPDDRVLVAEVTGFTGPGEFDRQKEQTSRPLTLIKGQRYYLEARHRDQDGLDHLSIAWRGPGMPSGASIPIGMTLEPEFTLEIWEDVARGAPSSLAVFATPPDRTERLFSMGSASVGVNVATRLRGRFVPPKDGEYRFLVTADDLAELRMLDPDAPESVSKLAELTGWTGPNGWDERSEQISSPLRLKAGIPVLLEVIHWQGSGPGHVGVGVLGPEGLDHRPIKSIPKPAETVESRTR